MIFPGEDNLKLEPILLNHDLLVADPPAPPPPDGRGPMIFYGQNADFSHFFPRKSLKVLTG